MRISATKYWRMYGAFTPTSEDLLTPLKELVHFWAAVCVRLHSECYELIVNVTNGSRFVLGENQRDVALDGVGFFHEDGRDIFVYTSDERGDFREVFKLDLESQNSRLLYSAGDGVEILGAAPSQNGSRYLKIRLIKEEQYKLVLLDSQNEFARVRIPAFKNASILDGRASLSTSSSREQGGARARMGARRARRSERPTL